MEYFNQFNWPVPKGFGDAIAMCKFEQGDILYNTKKAYEEGWNLDNIDWIIQVTSPSRGSSVSKDDDARNLFEQNWKSPVVLDITDVRKNLKRNISITQGKLFNTLRFGNIENIDSPLDDPPVPLFIEKTFNFLETARKYFWGQLPPEISKPNLFIIPIDELNSIQNLKFGTIKRFLSKVHSIKILSSSLEQCGILEWKDFNPMISFQCIAIDSSAPESIRDCLKIALWPKRDSASSKKTISSVLKRNKYSSVQHFSISNHGLFVPSVTHSFSNIRTISFKHKWFYRYRLHYDRSIASTGTLHKYLENLFENCPNHIFESSEFHCSKCKIGLPITFNHNTENEVISLAKSSRDFTELKQRHENLQKYFLENDKCTLAIEVPLWMESNEFSDYKNIFGTSDNLTGHIDLLRFIPSRDSYKIEVWDYKPSAYSEKYAATQVFLYAYMLSVRTGIQLTNISCGYFDEIDSFTFEPSTIHEDIIDHFINLSELIEQPKNL
jgi:hypothetical protein